MTTAAQPKTLENLRCPECGEHVFFATVLPDGWVMCREMGHWAGPIEECKRKTTPRTKVGTQVEIFCECPSCRATGAPELFMRYKAVTP